MHNYVAGVESTDTSTIIKAEVERSLHPLTLALGGPLESWRENEDEDKKIWKVTHLIRHKQ